MGNRTSKSNRLKFQDLPEKNNKKDSKTIDTKIESEIIDQSKLSKMKKNVKNSISSINNRKSIVDNYNNQKIINYSNENELREEYKIEINKYHHKINNKKVKISKKLKNYISTSKYT